MKKILLTLGFAAATLAASAQGISTTAAYDDFAKLDFYSIATKKLNVDSAAVNLSADAYMGVFWGEADQNGFKADFVRNTTNKTIDYTVSTVLGKYEPIWMGFGDYVDAIGDTKKPFTLDLSSNSVLKLSVTNNGPVAVRFSIQVQDIDDTTLGFISGAEQADFYNYNIGAVQGQSSAIPSLGSVDLEFDLSTCIVSAVPVGGGDPLVLADAKFDYSKVKALLFTVVADDNTGDAATGPKYAPLALTNHSVSISNLKLGDVTTISGIVDTEYASNSNLVWSAYDMMGTYVGANKYNDLVASLENGKVYVLRAGSNVVKLAK